MKSFSQFLAEPIYDKDMRDIELHANSLLKINNFYLRFANHFKDRINDERNGKQISSQEVMSLITKMYKKYPKLFIGLPKVGEKEVVFSDKTSAINVPAILRWSPKKNKYELFFKTIMRKKTFQSSNNGTPQYFVETVSFEALKNRENEYNV